MSPESASFRASCLAGMAEETTATPRTVCDECLPKSFDCLVYLLTVFAPKMLLSAKDTLERTIFGGKLRFYHLFQFWTAVHIRILPPAGNSGNERHNFDEEKRIR